MTQPDKLAAMNILSNMVSASYTAMPELYFLIVFQEVNLSLKYGYAGLSLYAYAQYGIILCTFVGDIEAGYQLGKLTLQLLDKLNAKEFIAKIYAPIYGIINHWQEHLKESLQPLQSGYSSGLESGDLEFTAYCANLYLFHSFFIGKELSSLAQEMATYNQAIAKLQQEPSLHKQQIYWQVVINLLSKNKNNCCLQGEVYNEHIMLPLHQQHYDQGAICYLYINKLMLCYLFAEYAQGIENAKLAQNYLDYMLGFFGVTLFNFYDSLTQLAVYSDASQDRQASILNHVKNNQDKMHKWAHHAPMNHLHKFYLVEAEKYRVLGDNCQAIDYYERALALAQENEYIQEEALANELAAKFYLEWGKEKIAQVYLCEAYYCYARWGASAKIADLEKRYPQLLAPILKPQNIPHHTSHHYNSLITSVRTHLSTSNSVSAVLDLVTVMKASQAFASEIQLDRLISTLMQVVMENAGAVKSTLILLQGNALVIKAMAEIGQETILKSIPVEQSQDIPISLINYVSHTKVTLVFDDGKLLCFGAADNGSLQPCWKINNEIKQHFFVGDPYIIDCQPKSILCTPILNQGKLLGLLYLENDFTTGAFTSDRVEILRLLCVQAAISLENAQLYQSLLQSETREREKAAELEQSLQQLQQAQLQLVQNEKMATLGNLVAGVAHEINNPLGFISGSINHAEEYLQNLIDHIKIYQEHYPHPIAAIEENAEEIDLDFLIEDLPKVINSMKVGTKRIRNISTSLRTFSRADTSEKLACNIHEGIESTLLILKYRLKANELRPAIEVIEKYADLPPVKCFLGQLNQVFMNIIANAIDALDEASLKHSVDELKAHPNQITIRTGVLADEHAVVISIKDNGLGMPQEVTTRIFDHLFTTKGVGKGTGLGLSIARQIVEDTHKGKLSCISAPGEGTEFIIQIPIQ
ncbi:ATP-binding protein [Amazonocrinis nigriterrae]|uniref:ATP-binding protein n=1 Tax=Amazonocrinis nigriterrae TaxID=2840443 RepID=UPI00298EE716|nr:ATP-binding protein [Amazonocrinis nigriterrae]